MMAGRWLWMVVMILAAGAVQAAGFVDAAGQLRKTQTIDVRLIGKDGRFRGPVEIRAFDMDANMKLGWYGYLIATDDSENIHSFNKIALYISRPKYSENGVNIAAENPLFAEKVSVPGRYIVRGFGRLFGEQLITDNDRLVTFTEVTQPYRVSGRVTDSERNPVANAKVLLENPGSGERAFGPVRTGEGMKEFLEYSLKIDHLNKWLIPLNSKPTSAEVDEILSAYLMETTTNNRGEWTINGESMPENATISISAAGFEPLKFSGLYNPDRPALPRWNNLMGGNYQTTTVKLLKQGKVRLMVAPKWTYEKLQSVEIKMSGGNEASNEPEIERSRKGEFKREAYGRIEDHEKPEYHVMVVPAEQPFEIVFKKTDFSQLAHNLGKPKSLYITVPIDPPLKPGEVREIGPLDFEDASKWVEGEGK